jgi:membrane protease YdiL (CAAX protease family)
LLFFKKTAMLRAIDAPPAQNPYRMILRRRMPEPVLALLLFLMGVWLWDNHFGHEMGYEDDACRMALVKIDRDLRLAESAKEFPPWLRTAAGIESLEDTIQISVESLAILGTENALDVEGAYALAILDAMRHGNNPVRGPFSDPRLPGPPDPRIIIGRVADGQDSWWDRQYLIGFGNQGAIEIGLKPPTAEEDSRNRELTLRAVICRCAVWVFALVGVFFVPRTLGAFMRALRSRSKGYVGRISANFGLGVFLLAYLASVGFERFLSAVIAGEFTDRPIYLEPPVLAALDAATRFLPALVALSFLYRRGGHVGSRLGLFAKPDLFLILGTFTLLTVIDFGLKHAFSGRMDHDPTGGLTSSESGWWGLVLALVSACLAAPVAEEILYRGVLFRSLANGLRVPAATLFSALVFAVVHFYEPYGLVSVGIFGAACALCFAASGNLATAILLHMLYNFVIKVPEWIVYHAPL